MPVLFKTSTYAEVPWGHMAVLPLVWSEEQSLSGFFISGAPSE